MNDPKNFGQEPDELDDASLLIPTSVAEDLPPDQSAAEPDQTGPGRPERLGSVDAYRGFVMFLMMAEVLRLCKVAAQHKESELWAWLCHHQTHVDWIGCSLHDLIQPSFSFLVGVALPYSIANRRIKGQSTFKMTAHAVWRSLVLVLLGVFLRSIGRERTNWTFEDTLSQIGLGYTFLFILGMLRVRTQVIALVVILVGYWLAFAVYPVPTGEIDPATTGVTAGASHIMTGFQAHWNKNTNIAWKFDTWFLNLFPRDKPWKFNGGGYSTLSFIPTLATMILGLLAGRLLRADGSRWAKLGYLLLSGLALLGLGYGLGYLGICPVVKKIWTPSWVLFSGGWCLLFLGGFYLFVDLLRLRPVFFPLIVIGMNSIAAYCLSHLIDGFIVSNLKTNFGKDVFLALGPEYATLVEGGSVLLILWLIFFWMYRNRVFVRI